jgi:hypothetical protein
MGKATGESTGSLAGKQLSRGCCESIGPQRRGHGCVCQCLPSCWMLYFWCPALAELLGKKGGTNKTKSSMVVGDNGVDLVGDDTMGPISQQGNERELLWGLEENPSQKGRE